MISNRSGKGSRANMLLDVGSESCWSPGYHEIFTRFNKWIRAIGGHILSNQISEVHLAADLVGTPINSLDISNPQNWITRSQLFTTHDNFRQLTGIAIGKGQLMLRIYDKVLELKNSMSKQLTFAESWGIKKYNDMEDINKVFSFASADQADYLWCLRDTLARSREINNLRWRDVDFQTKSITLYTRKKKFGTKTPRIIPMTERLFEILFKRHKKRDVRIEWVFWHRYYSRSTGQSVTGPYRDRKKFMKTLCKKAQVKYFRFHPLRHAGASLMESINIPIIQIQSILGHENRKTTEMYIHGVNHSSVDAIAKYEKARQ